MADEIVNGQNDETIIVPPDYEILRETKKSYYVKKPDGTKVFICKKCGAEFDTISDLGRHYLEHKKEEKGKEDIDEEITEPEGSYELSDIIDNDIQEKKITKTITPKTRPAPKITKEEQNKIETPKTPEEEMLEEMCKVLKEQMEATPGIGSGNKTEWFVNHFFRRMTALQEDKERLVAALRKHFPKADEDAIRLIADSVFEVREKYERSLRESMFFGNRQRYDYGYTGPSYYDYTPRYPRFERFTDFNNGALTIFYNIMKDLMEIQEQRFQMMMQMMQQQNTAPDYNMIKELIEYKVKSKIYEQEVKQLRDEVSRLYDYIQNENRTRPISGDGWRDDYARLVAELGSRGLQLLEQMVLENKKTRQLIIKYIAPKVIDRRFGEEEEEGHEPTGSGKSDKEIIEELKKENLVAEE